MIGAVLRSVGAVIVALMVAMALIMGVEVLSAIVHPFPPGVDPSDLEVCKAHVARYPAWVLVAAMFAWGCTAFVSSWVATRLGAGRHWAHGIVVGLMLLAAVILNMSMLPYPSWFWTNVIVFPVCFIAGSKLAGRRTNQPPPDDDRME